MNLDSVVSQAFFEAKYKNQTDPWHFASSDYELSRYDSIIAALNHKRYRRAFEPGCSVGVLSERLADLCDQVDAFDFSATAVEHASERCKERSNVRITQSSLKQSCHVEDYDLIVLSEIGYYFRTDDFRFLTDELICSLAGGSTLLASHWLGTSPDHVLSGNQVHEILAENSRLQLEHSEHHESFRLDRWVRS